MRGSCATLRRYIEAAWQTAEHRKPIIADCVAGNVGLSLAAFGAVGGFCHRAAEPEIFNVPNWRQGTRGGGQKKRIYAPKLDLFLPQEQAQLFLQKVNARKFVRGYTIRLRRYRFQELLSEKFEA